MAIYIYWFVLAFVLLGLEMATGTFYLLMVSIGMVVGGIAAWLDASVEWQLSLCALTVIAGSFILRHWKSTQVKEMASASLDIGQTVRVIKWNDNESARVFYRGAEWDAQLESSDTPREDTLYIAAVRGSCLVLTHRNLQH